MKDGSLLENAGPRNSREPVSEAFFLLPRQPMRTRLGGAEVLETGIRFAVSRQSNDDGFLTKSQTQ
jgi:hypothetical protein